MLMTLFIEPSQYEKAVSEIMAGKDFLCRETPVMFRDREGALVAVQHGEWGKPSYYEDLSALRKYIEEHSNVRADETVNLVSCYGGTFNKDELKQNHFNNINFTYYPVLYHAIVDKNRADYSIDFTLIENDKEAEAVIEELADSFFNMLPEEKRTDEKRELLIKETKRFMFLNKNAE